MSEQPKDQTLPDEELAAVVGGAVEGDPTQRSGGSGATGPENVTGQSSCTDLNSTGQSSC